MTVNGCVQLCIASGVLPASTKEGSYAVGVSPCPNASLAVSQMLRLLHSSDSPCLYCVQACDWC